MPDDPGEGATLSGVLDELARRGYGDHFTPVAGGLRAVDTDRVFGPDQLVISEYHRFEGVSDPDDMAIVYALETRTGIRGTLTDAFGVYADPRVGAFMGAVPTRSA